MAGRAQKYQLQMCQIALLKNERAEREFEEKYSISPRE